MRDITYRNTIIPAESFIFTDNEKKFVTSIRVAKNDDKRKFEFVNSSSISFPYLPRAPGRSTPGMMIGLALTKP